MLHVVRALPEKPVCHDVRRTWETVPQWGNATGMRGSNMAGMRPRWEELLNSLGNNIFDTAATEI